MKTNTQAPLKSERRADGHLLVHEVFTTIQGEGPFAGHPATFVRLAGCNLQCPACDTEYTGGVLQDPETLLDIVEGLLKADGVQAGLIVITGGEPLRQNIAPFCKLALDAGFYVQIETNGTLAAPEDLDEEAIIVCSPKTGRVHPDLVPRIHALKYVLEAGYVDTNGLPTRALMSGSGVWKPPTKSTFDIYVQPLDVQDEKENKSHMAVTVQSAMKYGYKLCLQMHKIAELK